MNQDTQSDTELTRTYTAAQLEAIGVPHEDGVIGEMEYFQSHRWYTVHRVVFRDPADGTTWSVLRADPATESQENDWWDRYGSADRITARRVEPREVTRTEWFEVAAAESAR
jgi:hypothetical protein